MRCSPRLPIEPHPVRSIMLVWRVFARVHIDNDYTPPLASHGIEEDTRGERRDLTQKRATCVVLGDLGKGGEWTATHPCLLTSFKQYFDFPGGTDDEQPATRVEEGGDYVAM